SINLEPAVCYARQPLAQRLFERIANNGNFVSQVYERRPQMALPTRVSRGMTIDPFESAQREFDTALNRFFGGRDAGDGGQGWAPYAVDVREDADHIYVEADLPGFKKNEIDVTLENQTLTISAEH